TNPLTGDWTEAPDSFTFDPATLFDADQGIPALLTEATGSAELIEDAASADDVPDAAQHYRLRTTVAAQRVAVLTGGLVTEESEVDLWIDIETSRVVEARFDLSIDGAESSWRMTISDYDAEVTIVPPELAAAG
ncbi:MAG: LppX_LprAFG lipoprotein, partial [Acidimicrobiia bacterium]|nr:LppX_LprAFG lipoprotein [Acidimicrobiia bacterium]